MDLYGGIPGVLGLFLAAVASACIRYRLVNDLITYLSSKMLHKMGIIEIMTTGCI